MNTPPRKIYITETRKIGFRPDIKPPKEGFVYKFLKKIKQVFKQ